MTSMVHPSPISFQFRLILTAAVLSNSSNSPAFPQLFPLCIPQPKNIRTVSRLKLTRSSGTIWENFRGGAAKGLRGPEFISA